MESTLTNPIIKFCSGLGKPHSHHPHMWWESTRSSLINVKSFLVLSCSCILLFSDKQVGTRTKFPWWRINICMLLQEYAELPVQLHSVSSGSATDVPGCTVLRGADSAGRFSLQQLHGFLSFVFCVCAGTWHRFCRHLFMVTTITKRKRIPQQRFIGKGLNALGRHLTRELVVCKQTAAHVSSIFQCQLTLRAAMNHTDRQQKKPTTWCKLLSSSLASLALPSRSYRPWPSAPTVRLSALWSTARWGHSSRIRLSRAIRNVIKSSTDP